GDGIVLGELELVVAAVGQVREEAGGELGDLGTHAPVQLAAQIRERPVELVVKPLTGLERADLPLPLRPLGFASLGVPHVVFGAAASSAIGSSLASSPRTASWRAGS